MLGKNFLLKGTPLLSKLSRVDNGQKNSIWYRDWKLVACLGALGILVTVGSFGQVQAADTISTDKFSNIVHSDTVNSDAKVSGGIDSNTKIDNAKVSNNKKFQITSANVKAGTEVYSLVFNSEAYELRTSTVNGETISYRAYENIPYVAKPVDVGYQYMNIYIPEAYYENASQGKYTKDTAPIFFPNSVGGYRPSQASKPAVDREGNPNAVLMALSKGLVVAAPATRGRSNESADGTYIGKAPAVIVDLKAAVAYLHSNDDEMPGDANKIISNGTSAGGAVSLLLGASGNSLDYNSYLSELGVASYDTSIYAVSAYCPITDLDHADMAYEWSYNGINSYAGMGGMPGQQEPPDPTLGNGGAFGGEEQTASPNSKLPEMMAPKADKNKSIILKPDAIAYSKVLKDNFPQYINSLQLQSKEGTPLTLEADGTGTFMTYAKSYIIDSAYKAKLTGTDISDVNYLIYDSQDSSKIVDVDWAKYNASVGRMKAPGAFDARDNSSGENNLFGTTTIDNQHFTAIASIQGDGTSIADFQTIKMMNPLNYISPLHLDGVNYNQNTANYWRIRYGEHDNNTSMAVPLIVATRLQNYGYNVDFALPWGIGHAGDYDLEELFDWIDRIV